MTTQGQIDMNSKTMITLIYRNCDGVPVRKTIVYPDGREETEELWRH